MKVRAKCDFPYIKVVGEIKESDNCITFHGINSDVYEFTDRNGKKQYADMFVFNAFGDMKERVKRLKIRKGSELTVSGYMKKWYEAEKEDKKGQQYANYSYDVLSVDFLPNRCRKSDNQPEKEQEQPLSIPTEKVVIIDNTSSGVVDIEEIRAAFCN